MYICCIYVYILDGGDSTVKVLLEEETTEKFL